MTVETIGERTARERGGPTRPPDAERSVGDLMLDVSDMLRETFKDACAREQLTVAEGRALRFVTRGIPQSRLGELLSCGAPRVTELLNSLEGRGLVRRRAPRGDRRTRTVTPTPAGTEVLTRIHAHLDTTSPLMLRLSTAERGVLETLLRRLDGDRGERS